MIFQYFKKIPNLAHVGFFPKNALSEWHFIPDIPEYYGIFRNRLFRIIPEHSGTFRTGISPPAKRGRSLSCFPMRAALDHAKKSKHIGTPGGHMPLMARKEPARIVATSPGRRPKGCTSIGFYYGILRGFYRVISCIFPNP